jgi:transposase
MARLNYTDASRRIGPNALAIKRSIGLVRGKTDKIDAGRIAAYGYEKRDKLQPAVATDETLKGLQRLHSTRDRLVKQEQH